MKVGALICAAMWLACAFFTAEGHANECSDMRARLAPHAPNKQWLADQLRRSGFNDPSCPDENRPTYQQPTTQTNDNDTWEADQITKDLNIAQEALEEAQKQFDQKSFSNAELSYSLAAMNFSWAHKQDRRRDALGMASFSDCRIAIEYAKSIDTLQGWYDARGREYSYTDPATGETRTVHSCQDSPKLTKFILNKIEQKKAADAERDDPLKNFMSSTNSHGSKNNGRLRNNSWVAFDNMYMTREAAEKKLAKLGGSRRLINSKDCNFVIDGWWATVAEARNEKDATAIAGAVGGRPQICWIPH
jgi:hypothetical protein